MNTDQHDYYLWPRRWVLIITLLALVVCLLLLFGWKP